MITRFIIASAVFIVVMVAIFTDGVVACVISTVDGVAMTHFLPPFVQCNVASSMCCVEESGPGIWETAHCV